MHVIAAKAVALGEALKPEFKTYQKQVLENAKTMAAVLQKRGLRIVSGRTDCHMFLVDLTPKNITGKDAEAALGRAHITVNKNAIPNDPQKPMVTSGVRIGSPAMTTRGFSKTEAELLAGPDRRRARQAGGRRQPRARGGRGQGALREVSGLHEAHEVPLLRLG